MAQFLKIGLFFLPMYVVIEPLKYWLVTHRFIEPAFCCCSLISFPFCLDVSTCPILKQNIMAIKELFLSKSAFGKQVDFKITQKNISNWAHSHDQFLLFTTFNVKCLSQICYLFTYQRNLKFNLYHVLQSISFILYSIDLQYSVSFSASLAVQ